MLRHSRAIVWGSNTNKHAMPAYNVWMSRQNGGHIVNPTRLYADGLVAAQHRAAAILAELQSKGCLADYVIDTVTDAA